MPAPTNKRVAVPFLFRAADGLGPNGKLLARSYGATVEGVFTRAAKSRSGSVVAAHSQPLFAEFGGEHALALSAGPKNHTVYSQEFDQWTANGTGTTVTTNTTVAPDFTTTADTLTPTTTNSLLLITPDVKFTTDGTKSASLFVKAGTSTRTDVELYDLNAAAVRHRVRITWASGVPTVATQSGTGTVFETDSVGNGWYRIGFSAASCVAANDNQVRIYPDTSVGTGTVIVWGAQSQDVPFVSGYVPTTTTAATGVADALYFPFTLPPQACTVYVRFIERGVASGGGTQGVIALGNDTNAAFLLTGGAGTYYAVHRGGGDVNSSGPSGVAVVGDTVELMMTVSSAGVVQTTQSINGGTATVDTASSAKTLPSAWTNSRIYLGSRTAGTEGVFAFTHACVSLGTKTMAEMRVLAEVL